MFHVPEQYRRRWTPGDHPALRSAPADGNNGAFLIPPRIGGRALYVIASDGMGWEHVSVHAYEKGRAKTPVWDEMAYVKGLFWDPEDAVMQLHPPASQYVNMHPHTLHLWRPTQGEIPLPPSILVGYRGVTLTPAGG